MHWLSNGLADSAERAWQSLPEELRDAMQLGVAYPTVYHRACNAASAWLLFRGDKEEGGLCELAALCQHESLGAAFHAQLRAQRACGDESVQASGVTLDSGFVERARGALARLHERGAHAVVSLAPSPCTCGWESAHCRCRPSLLATRCVPGAPTVVLQLFTADSATEDVGAGDAHSVASAVRDVLRAANEGMKAPVDTKEQRLAWWQGRVALDTKLGRVLRHVDDAWLGAWRAVLLNGVPPTHAALGRVADDLVDAARSSAPIYASPGVARGALALLMHGAAAGAADRGEVAAALRALSGASHVETASLADELVALAGGASDSIEPAAAPSCLVLGSPLGEVPWESLPKLPSHFAAYRVPSLGACASMAPTHASAQVASAYYLLNPSGDLAETEARFAPLFKDNEEAFGWNGCAGAPPPSATAAVEALASRDLFVYLGHGGGQRYFGGARFVRALSKCASSVLMGCSSGRLATGADPSDARGVASCRYEPGGGPLCYLHGGCPAAVGNLWDVTDGDIDRFAASLFQTLGIAEDAGSRGKALKPRSRKAAAKGKPGCSKERDIGAALAPARAACKLRYLTGAAPVVYGLPTACRA